MKRLLYALAVAAAATAAQADEEPKIVTDMRGCVAEKAARYAALDASLSDAADAAFAACDPILDEMRPPKYKADRPEDVRQVLDEISTRMRLVALAAVAEARLARQ